MGWLEKTLTSSAPANANIDSTHLIKCSPAISLAIVLRRASEDKTRGFGSLLAVLADCSIGVEVYVYGGLDRAPKPFTGELKINSHQYCDDLSSDV